MASSVNRRIEGYLSRVMGQRDPAGLIRPRPTEPIRACGLAPRHQAGHMTAIGLRCRHAEKSLRGRGHPHMTRWVPAGSGNRRVVEKAIGYAISADMSPQLAECIAALPEDHWKADQPETDAIREWA